MGQAITYDDYQQYAADNHLKLKFTADQMPISLRHQVIWQCMITGQIFARSWHHMQGNDYPSQGQRYWKEKRVSYYDTAMRLGLEFIFDPEIDYAPDSIKAPVKWKNKEGRIVVASFHQVGYENIKVPLREALLLNGHR